MPLRRFARVALALAALALAGDAGPIAAEASIEERLTRARTTLASQRARREQVQASLEERDLRRSALEQRIESNGRALYRLSRGGLLPMASGLDGLLNHASRMERLERILETDLKRLESFDDEGKALKREAAELGASLSSVEQEIAKLEKKRAGLLQQQISQSAYVPSAQPAPGGGRMNYGLSIVGGAGLARERFVEQRGSLALPVSGPSSIQEANRAESGGPGLEFVASRGAAIRAVASGRVAFSDRYGSYGQLVIIDHGERYYTVYGGFGLVDVQVGDEVSKSARLGTAGAEPVYFEVRRGTKTESARPWLGL